MGTSSFILSMISVALLAGPGSPASAGGDLVSSHIEDRVVKFFDFDEPDHYESMPKYWRQMTEPAFPGYPRYQEPAFDFDVGHTAPPSFRLSLSGGNIGAHYLAKDTSVHPRADYRITAWVRTSGLRRAGASVSAYYLDHALRKIEKSEQCTGTIRDEECGGDWTRLSIHLPGGFETARWIGLSCRIEQPPERTGGISEPRPINYRDALSTAWFDDITVLRLPQASIGLAAPGNVFLSGRPITCAARVADLDGAGLDAELEIVNAEGATVESHVIPVVGLDQPGVEIAVAEVPAGWYVARLSVRASGCDVLVEEQPFLRLSPDLPGTTANERAGFGVIIDTSVVPEDSVNAHLLAALSVTSAKVPLWRRDVDDDAVVKGDKKLDRWMSLLRGRGMTVVATLADPPGTLATLCGHPELTLLDVLTSPPNSWRPYLALTLSRHGAHIDAWQIGEDGRGSTMNDRRLGQAISNVRAELQPLIGPAALVAPASVVRQSPGENLPVEVVSLMIPQQVSASRLSGQLSTPETGESVRLWATVEPPSADRYDRYGRLAELARRIAVARQSGVETVFVPQPWRAELAKDAVVVSPQEDFIICRTLAQGLGGLEPVTPVWLGDGVRAWLFADRARVAGTVVAWTEGDQAGPMSVLFDVGAAAERIDMWGKASQPQETEGGRAFQLEAMPVLIRPVSPQRVMALSSFQVSNPRLQATVEEQARDLVLSNPRSAKLHGTLRLRPPKNWRVRPERIPVDLAGGQSTSVPVSLNIPNNQAMGSYVLIGRLDAEGDALNGLTLRAPLRVESPGLDVSVLVRRDGDGLAIVQRVTNLTDESLNLRAILIAPGHARQGRLITNLAAGQTTTRQFEIEHTEGLAGKYMRVSVEQIGGPLKCNELIKLD
ncbi:MAG: NEW3 domain-containing protein [Planctomycetota bacterium]